MAWSDVPTKLAEYAAEEYAPDDAVATLLSFYDVVSVEDVSAHLQDEFERDLNYRLGACINLKNSKAVKPT